jgi:hypothetical protein
MIRLAYLALEKALKEVAELKQIDWFASQLERSDINNAVYDLPAAFVEMVSMNTNAAQGYALDIAELNFKIHIYSFTGSTASDHFKSEGLQHHQVIDMVSNKLRNFNLRLKQLFPDQEVPTALAEYFVIDNTQRLSITPVPYIDSWLNTEIKFKSTVFDFASLPNFTKHAADLELLINTRSAM